MANKINGLDHIGIAVKDINAHLALYKDMLGLEFEGIEEVADQKIKAAILDTGDAKIELIEPTSEDSPISKFLGKKGDGMHHIAIAVENIESVIENLMNAGVKMIDEKPRIGAHSKKIAFIHPKSTGGVLVEICE